MFKPAAEAATLTEIARAWGKESGELPSVMMATLIRELWRGAFEAPGIALPEARLPHVEARVEDLLDGHGRIINGEEVMEAKKRGAWLPQRIDKWFDADSLLIEPIIARLDRQDCHVEPGTREGLLKLTRKYSMSPCDPVSQVPIGDGSGPDWGWLAEADWARASEGVRLVLGCVTVSRPTFAACCLAAGWTPRFWDRPADTLAGITSMESKHVPADEPDAAQPAALPALAALEEWYRERVRIWPSGTRPPSRDDDWQASQERFGKAVKRDVIRSLRRKLAPSKWQKAGRRRPTPNRANKSGKK